MYLGRTRIFPLMSGQSFVQLTPFAESGQSGSVVKDRSLRYHAQLQPLQQSTQIELWKPLKILSSPFPKGQEN